MRKGVGTIRRFVGDPNLMVIGLERDGANGNVVPLPVERETANALVKKYGVQGPQGTDMQGIVGLRVEYEETATGMLTVVKPLPN